VLEVELDWIEGWLIRVCGSDGARTIVNLGSGEVDRGRPQLDRLSVVQRTRLVNVDLHDGDGVDVVGDLSEPELWEALTKLPSPVFVMSNVLEHVIDPLATATVVESQIPAGAHLIVTVPLVYPHHPDPIDNGLRLSGSQICGLFPSLTVIASATVVGPRYGRLLLANRLAAAKTLLAGPFLRRTRDRWGHLPRAVQAGCAILHKAGS
jgi:hypothetical protein